MKRVVVTGLGLVTPLGCGVELAWSNLVASKSGVSAITRIDVSDIPARVAGQVPRGDGVGDFRADDWVPPKEQKKMDIFIHFAMAAADEAV